MSIVDFTEKNLGSFSVNIMKGQQVLDARVVPVTYNTNVLFEASQKLGAITASVKGVSKLIHNMLVGSTFLEPIEGAWMTFGAAVDKGVKYNNSNAVLIQNRGATQDSYHGVYFFVEGLMPQKKYTISTMVRTDNLKGMDEGAAIEIKMTDNGQGVRLCDPFQITPTKENEWQKVEFTFIAPGRITSEKVQVRFQLWRNGHLWISQPMMNAGEVAADYTANIKDIQLSLAQIKLTANTISQSVTDLNTGLESVGIHLNGAEKKITLHGDTEMVDANGKHVAMFKDGKIITEAIDADKVVTKGIQSKTIDAKDATFENVNISGDLTIRRLRYKANAIRNNKLDCSFIYGPEDLTMPILEHKEFMQITVLVPMVTRVVAFANLKVGRSSDCFLYKNESFLEQGIQNVSLSGFVELLGIGVSPVRTIWLIMKDKE